MPVQAYYQAHKEACLASATKYYNTHKEEVSKRQKIYRVNNPDKMRDRDRAYWEGREDEHVAHTNKWRVNNPEKFKILKATTKARRRARELNAPGSFTTKDWMQKVEYYGWRCAYCNLELTPDTLTLDHVKPLSKGGSNWVSNFVPSCSPCNRKKWDHLDHLHSKIDKIKRISPNNGQC